MKITFNEKEKSIEIKDGLKTQFLLLKISLGFVLANSVLFPVFVLDKKQFEWMGFIWILLGLAIIVLIAYQLLKKTASEKLKLSDISSLNEKQFFGRKMLRLKLNNGKTRDLIDVKSQKDISEIKEFFNTIGIQTS
ncbi:hypothetical protein [Gelidibacter pelagius]|uniref:PH (Pleckstrin Homology) domain-containing protein n=1 Tax=Gelidibacter pelagius TaxID=2819985 RepID=A0ABS3SNW0_9FLAO|nr:hypothetical protein [Gelidibacter pelagius]MBO3097398.1 hypothetical protein [Gelidibacter pelagius]